MYSTDQIFQLVRIYTEVRQIAVSTLGRLAVGSSSVLIRIERDQATVRTIKRLVQYLSDDWPPSTDWPEDIPRPEPSSDSQLEQGEVA